MSKCYFLKQLLLETILQNALGQEVSAHAHPPSLVRHVKTTENKPQKHSSKEALQGINDQTLRNNFICTIFNFFLQLPATLKLTPVQ